MSPTHDLRYLQHLLETLPDNLPYQSAEKSCYRFQEFALPEDCVEDLGVEGAANRELEVRLGPRTGPGDTFVLSERGPGLTALVAVLKNYTKDFPKSVILSKWVEDACRAAENVFRAAQIPVRVVTPVYSSKGEVADSLVIFWVS